MPKWLKVIINTVLTLTVFYWLGYMIYKVLSVIRYMLHTISEKNHWWFFLLCLFGTTLAIMIICELCTQWTPFTNMWNDIKNFVNWLRKIVADFIEPK